jgi:hypothetical protein
MGDIFGGNSGGTTYNMPAPAAPAPIDYEAMYSAARKYGKLMLGDQMEAALGLYPQMTNLQFGTADEMARRLDNDYFKRARGVIGSELDAASAPNQIEAELQRQAQEELALGRSLSPEQERAAQQSARAAFAARGLGTSAGSSAAEILNRDAMSQQRLDQRRQFALGANQIDLARRQRRIGLAGAYGDMDPYRQGLNAAFQLGGATLDRSTNMASNAFNNSLQTAGNVETFNRNLQGNMYNSWQNNNAAIQGANLQAGAMRQAGMMGMFGQIGSSIFSDKRMKADIKPVGKAGNVLGLTAYEFRYKGDKEKHVGFMAQDVKKVLPEAVEEVDHKGKKRLTIKPAVIGAAIAEQLSQAKAA